MRRVTVSDIMRETGLSRATIDRALNGRGRVHPRTQQVITETVRNLQRPPGEKSNGPSVDMIVRVGRGMTQQFSAVWRSRRPAGEFYDVYRMSEAEILRLIAERCSDLSRPLILTVKNTDAIVEALRTARQSGKRVITVVSDVAADARDHFVGIDNRAAGLTAAYIIGRALGDRPTTVGVVVGNTAFRCHEDREIGFRTGLRANFPRVILTGEAQGEDNPQLTCEAVLKMLSDNPALGAIYNVGGGNQGLVAALKEAGRGADVLLVGHEVNGVTLQLLRDNHLHYAIASDPAALLDEALRAATAEPGEMSRDSTLIDFGIYTRFNIPAFATIRDTRIQ